MFQASHTRVKGIGLIKGGQVLDLEGLPNRHFTPEAAHHSQPPSLQYLLLWALLKASVKS